MQFRTQKRILAAVLGGCILAVNVPLETGILAIDSMFPNN